MEKTNLEKFLDAYEFKQLTRQVQRQEHLDWIDLSNYLEKAYILGYNYLLDKLYDDDILDEKTYGKYEL